MRACEGGGREPLPSTVEKLTTHGDNWDDTRKTTYVIDGRSITQWSDPSRHVCSVCYKPKQLLKSGVMPKHTRHVSWKEQQANVPRS